MKGNRLTVFILVAMVLGVLTGYIVHEKSSPESIQKFSTNIKLLTTMFLRLVQMIIAPLVFTTLVVGIAKLGDLKTVGRVGGKAYFGLFAIIDQPASWFSACKLFHPGTVIDLSNADSRCKDLVSKTQEFSLPTFVEHVFPKSFIEAMATNEILQLVVFSIFFGVAATALGDYAKPVIHALDVASHIILKVVGYVMNFAPLGVFGAIAAVIATKGLQVFNFYAQYFFYFLIGIAILWIILIGVGYLILRNRMPQLFKEFLNHY
jgi:Na+/H+-dicarboxylate symporter